jgi:hypothetical protein
LETQDLEQVPDKRLMTAEKAAAPERAPDFV